MSQLVERIEGHQVFKELDEFDKALELAKESSKQDLALVDNWDRAQAVAFHARQVLEQINPFLAAPGMLSNISTPLQQAGAEIRGFIATNNIGHWVNAQSQLDNCLVHLARLPLQTRDDAVSMREVALTYRTTVAQLLDALKRDGIGISKRHAELQTKIDDSNLEIANQKQRLDNAIATFQQQFSDAQQARQTEFASAERNRDAVALKSEEERHSNFNQVMEYRGATETEAAQAFADAHANLIKDLNSNADTILTFMGEKKTHVQKLVGIITNTGMAHGFQKTANEERDAASTWKVVAAVSLVVWIVFGGVFFALTYDKDLTLSTVARQFLLSTPFVLLAGFAAVQVSRHQKNERQMRQAELEIASIDPFLATLSDEDRNDVKREFASRYFGQREVDQKKDPADSNLLDVVGSLAKLVQELAKK